MSLKKPIASIVLLVFLFLQAGSAWAETTPPPVASIPKPIKDCDKLSPVYPRTDKGEIDTSKIDITKPYKDQYALNFRIAFEKTRTNYHAYMECVFEKVVEGMMGSSGANTKGIFGANAPNAPEWSKPESACIPEKSLVDNLKDGSPETLLKPLLDTYNDYVDYLQLLFIEASTKIDTTKEGIDVKLDELRGQNEAFKLLVENETQDALAALDGAFIGLKEMRQAFVMHVHFQCMLKNLERYRRAMENLRKVISAIPSVIIDASIHK
jgi:hypothetical protein